MRPRLIQMLLADPAAITVTGHRCAFYVAPPLNTGGFTVLWAMVRGGKCARDAIHTRAPSAIPGARRRCSLLALRHASGYAAARCDSGCS
jgi:hypothetical protein